MCTILVVDDHAPSRSLLSKLLRLEGHLPVLAENVWQALAILETHRVDLIILDFNLPGMDGDGLLAELAADARFHDLPVIMLTAQPVNDTLCRLHRRNIRDWLTKGDYSPTELMVAVEQHLPAEDNAHALAN
jgi:CheY-like chemotaxis protein